MSLPWADGLGRQQKHAQRRNREGAEGQRGANRAREREIERHRGERGERRPFLDCVTAVLFRT
jgi:hypothetical protein